MPRTDECADLDEFFDGQLCAAAARHFRRHMGDCRTCQEELHVRMQLSVLTGQLRRPRLPERLLELARTVRDVAPVVAIYAALAVLVALQGGRAWWSEERRARWTVRW